VNFDFPYIPGDLIGTRRASGGKKRFLSFRPRPLV